MGGLLESLESRLLLSASDPSGQEQELLWLTNRMRTNPQAELQILLNTNNLQIQQALQFFNVDRNLLAQQWASLTPVQPVAWNTQLALAATAHNQAMAQADQQSHQLPGEPALAQRLTNAGYQFSFGGENIYAFTYSPLHAHAAFAIDWGSGLGTTGGIQNPPDHRIDIMTAGWRDAGVNWSPNLPTSTNTGPFLTTMDFGQPLTAQASVLVGTVFRDNNADGAYNSGEGIGGVTVTVVGGGHTFTTTSMSAGGYQIALPNGTYTVSFSGNLGVNARPSYSVTVNGQNQLLDVDAAQLVGGVGGGNPGSSFTPQGVAVMDFWPGGIPKGFHGWAVDRDNPSQSIQVRLDVDGVAGTPVDASETRNDLMGLFGAANHGFHLSLPALSAGRHTLSVVAIDPVTGETVVIGSRTVNSTGSAAFGFARIDANGVVGWAFDPAVGAGPIQVRVDVDGTTVTTTTANLARSDMTALVGSPDHGFRVNSLGVTTSGFHVVQVFAIDGSGTPVLIGSRNVNFGQGPVGVLGKVTPFNIVGWAVDPDNLSTPEQVRIDIDGTTFNTFDTFVQRGDLAQFGTNAFGFNIVTPALSAGTHTVSLFGIDSQTGTAVLLGTKQLITTGDNRPPIGVLGVVDASHVAGWAADPDDQTASIQIRIDIDGTTVTTAAADINRPDLVPMLTGGAHGFNVTLPVLSLGIHSVQVFALDSTTNAATLIGSRTIDTSAMAVFVAKDQGLV